jgi:hypothetical protein
MGSNFPTALLQGPILGAVSLPGGGTWQIIPEDYCLDLDDLEHLPSS